MLSPREPGPTRRNRAPDRTVPAARLRVRSVPACSPRRGSLRASPEWLGPECSDSAWSDPARAPIRTTEVRRRTEPCARVRKLSSEALLARALFGMGHGSPCERVSGWQAGGIGVPAHLRYGAHRSRGAQAAGCHSNDRTYGRASGSDADTGGEAGPSSIYSTSVDPSAGGSSHGGRRTGDPDGRSGQSHQGHPRAITGRRCARPTSRYP